MRVAAVQFRAGSDKVDNTGRLCRLVEAAADDGADLVVCPEAAMHGFGRPADPLAPVAEPLDGPFVAALADVARRRGVTVLAGMFEPVPEAPDRAYNTVVALGPDGALAGRYRKLHLFDALGWTESARLAPGDGDLLTLRCGDLVVGVLTCYDLRFPELARALVDAGADLLAVPAAWVAGPLKEDQWLTLLRARAIENTCWVVGAGQPGPEYAGRSTVVDPLGVAVAGLGVQEGVAVATVTAGRVAEVRRAMPSLTHRRLTVQPPH